MGNKIDKVGNKKDIFEETLLLNADRIKVAKYITKLIPQKLFVEKLSKAMLSSQLKGKE